MQAVQHLATSALQAMLLAEQGMEGLVDCIIEWMAVIHEEVIKVQSLLRAHHSTLLGVS